MILPTSARNKKTKVQNKVPFPELVHSSNNSKAIARGKSPTKSTIDLHRYSNRVVGSNEWAQ